MNTHAWSQTLRIILFSCFIGGAAGVIGASFTTDYLTQYALGLAQNSQSPRSLQVRPRALPQSYEEALEHLEERSLPAVGTLFASQEKRDSGVSLFTGTGTVVALTSDGWMLSTVGRVADTVNFESQTCDVDRIVTEPRFGFLFLHCEVSGASVVDLVGGYELDSGSQVFVVGIGRDLVSTYVRQVVWGDVVRTSDIPSRRVLLEDENVAQGAAVFNIFGEFVGIVMQEETGLVVIPFEHLSGAFEQLLKSSESISYPTLGVYGIDLARAVGVSSAVSRGYREGFVLYGSRAVAQGSAAEQAQLQEGDILLSVDGVAMDAHYALDDLLTAYQAHDELEIEIDRTGTRQDITVTLGEQVF